MLSRSAVSGNRADIVRLLPPSSITPRAKTSKRRCLTTKWCSGVRKVDYPRYDRHPRPMLRHARLGIAVLRLAAISVLAMPRKFFEASQNQKVGSVSLLASMVAQGP